MSETHHGDYAVHSPAGPASDRAFGIVIAFACAVVAGLRLWHGSRWGWAFAALAVAFAALAFAAPRTLTPLNRIWFFIGRVLHVVVSPVVFGLVFFGVVTPVGLLMRRAGHRPLTPNFEPEAGTYWVSRAAEARRPGAMSKQY